MIKKFTCLIFAILLSGCSTAIRYSEWTEGKPYDANGIRFALQDTLLTLDPPETADSPAAAAKADPAKKTASPTVKKLDCSSNLGWWTCFNGVKANAVMAPLAGKIYAAEPDDIAHLNFTTTAISGVPVPDQDGLYTAITVKYSNNTASIISEAAMGASAGLTLGGSLGLGIGLVLIPVENAVSTNRLGVVVHPTADTIKNYICNGAHVNLSENLKPTLFLPLTIAGADARPYSPTADVLEGSAASSCWRPLPNSGHLNEAQYKILSAKEVEEQKQEAAKPHEPTEGDGWFYRFVDADENGRPVERKLLQDEMAADDYFKFNGSRSDFPYSSCRKVQLQITWWKDLASGVFQAETAEFLQNAKTLPEVGIVSFPATMATPSIVKLAFVKHGGVVNFKKDCGAIVAMTGDLSKTSAINASIKAAQDLHSAQEAWNKSQSK